MAKKKIEENIEGGHNEKLRGILAGMFGGDVLVNGQDYVQSKKIVIPVSPMHDRALGGGIPEGSFVIVTGPPKAGKSISCLDFSGTALSPEFSSSSGQRELFIVPVENRLKARDLNGIKHLDLSRVHIIQPQDDKEPLYAEEQLDAADTIINTVPGALVLIDSFSALCSKEERASDIGDRFRANVPLMLAKFCRRVANIIPRNKTIVMGITHMIANQGQGHSLWTEASGRKIQYQMDVKLKCTHIEKWEDASGFQIGQKINWVCETSAIGGPGAKYQSYFRYNYGIDKEAELVDICVDLGLIKKGGAWFSIGEQKVQGLEKAAEFLRANPDEYNNLNKQVRVLMGYPTHV